MAKLLLIASLLYASQISMLPADILQRERNAMRNDTDVTMFVVTAQYADGQPMTHGYIACEGFWHKYEDEKNPRSGYNIPFEVDSRGGAIFNPWRTDEEDYITCSATDLTGKRGSVTFEIYLFTHATIIVR